jgi:hypothetical protein
MSSATRVAERVTIGFLVALVLFSYARLYGLRDVYADDNCWLFGLYLYEDLAHFLGLGFIEMRREGLGMFLYAFFQPFLHLENPYPVWHSLVLGIQVATVLVWYAMVRNFCGDKLLAALAAIALVVVPLDHSLPYLSAVNYRASLLLGLLSLYLSDSAARRGTPGWELPSAVVLAVVAQWFLHEAAIAFEPARLFMLWVRFRGPGQSAWLALRRAEAWWTRFGIAALLVVAYKLTLPPFGIYGRVYSVGVSEFLNWDAIERTLALLALGQWRSLLHLSGYAQPGSAILAALAAGAALACFAWHGRHAPWLGSTNAHPDHPRVGTLVTWGLLLFLPQICIFFLAGRPPKLGLDSTHAALLQPGFAFLCALGACAVVRYLLLLRAGSSLAALALALGVGLGVFFSNLNLDLFRQATHQERQFWKAFAERFPTLPAQADFLIDAAPVPYATRTMTYYQWEDLTHTYDLEFRMHQLYPSALGRARRYRVYDTYDLSADLQKYGRRLFEEPELPRITRYGEDTLFPKQITVIRYRNGELLVNREILELDRSIPYSAWADKPLPSWARPRPAASVRGS